MSNKYELKITNKTARRYKKLVANNKQLQQKIQDTLKLLINEPFDQKLKTHKVQISNYGIVYSSSVTGDIRIIWEFENKRITIIILDIGGHSGNKSIYK